MDLEFQLTDRDFHRVRALIHQRAGIALSEQKRQMVYSRIARRLRDRGMSDFGTYLDSLEAEPDSLEWELFVNALTTNLTAFFREEHHFPVLKRHVARTGHPVRIWCAAASTGEEPYSIAMTLVDALGSRAAQSTLLATDINTEVLEKARAGVYAIEQLDKVAPEQRRRFFYKGVGPQEGKALVRPELMAMVKFEQLNLLNPVWDLKGPFDAIFCRNTMIYFDKATQAKLLDRFAALLKPDGLLFAGHSENFSFANHAFCSLGQTVYGLSNGKRL